MSRPAVTSDNWQLVICAFRHDPAITCKQFIDALEKCVAAAKREGADELDARVRRLAMIGRKDNPRRRDG